VETLAGSKVSTLTEVICKV